MNELECRNENCDNIVPCDVGVISVRCGYCCVINNVNVEESNSCCS